MRIGLVCPYSMDVPGGVQNHVLGLAGWLHEQGHRVEILAPGLLPAGIADQYGLSTGQVSSAGPALPLKFNGSVARVCLGPRAARRARGWLADHEFDLIHLHEPLVPSLCTTVTRTSGVPLVATFHASMPTFRLVRAVYRLSVGPDRLDTVLAVSALAARVALTYTGRRPEVIGNGIRVPDRPVASTRGRWRNGEHPLAVFVGRFEEPRKGFGLLVEALPGIRARYPDLEVVVIGSGAEQQLPGVRFLGGVDDATRNEWLTRADVYLAPNTGRESFGIILLEALACGAPVVAADLQAFRAVLSDEQGPVGRVFRVGSTQALTAEVIASLDEDRDLRLARGLAQAARYDWSAIGPRILGAYDRAGAHFLARSL